MSEELVFALNGEVTRIPASEVDPQMSLNEYLRTKTPFHGTKLGCGEGGCGVCTVALSRHNGGKVETISVVSCLRPLALCDGWAITTTEGLGNTKDGLHPIQKRLRDFNGMQCGFCTPGFVMSMYAALQSPESTTGEGLSAKGVENNLDGNICRCTGYRPIIDTFKSLCKDHNVTDMVSKKAELGPYPSSSDPKFPPRLKNYAKKSLNFSAHGVKWLRPTSLKDVLSILNSNEPRSVRLVAGRTGYAFDKREYSILVDIHALPELLNIESKASELRVGAGVSLTNLMRALRTHSSKSCIFNPLATLIERIASTQIRNVGSVAGNLVMAKQLPFVSDLATGLLAAQASVTLIGKNSSRKMSIDAFLSSPRFNPGEMVSSISIPFTKPNHHYNAFKAASRHQNAYSLVNAAFYFKMNGSAIKKAVCAFGYSTGRSNQRLNRASKLEEYLQKKRLTKDTLERAIDILKEEIVPKGEDKKYRQNVMMGFFYRFFLSLIKVKPATLASLTVPFSRPLTSSSQSFTYPATHAPVSEPIPEISGNLKVCGEAQFTDDYPIKEGTLYAAFVTSKEARAKIISIDASEALKRPGVVKFLSAKDVPGENNCSGWGEVMPLFADKEVMFHGQSVGLILATSPDYAWKAAEYVMVRYDRAGQKPVVSLEQAKEQKTQIFNTSQHTLGEIEADGKNEFTLKGKIFMGTQQHFYMETQVSYCVPDEDGKVILYCSLQYPHLISTTIGTVLGIGHHSINVVHRRAGGAFGGKLDHHIRPACAVAVATYVTGRAVKMAVRRGEDTQLAGGREEVSTNYTISFDKTGKISHANFDTSLNAGCVMHLAEFANTTVPHASNECYDWKNYHHISNLYRTNTAPRTAMRAPGDVQAAYIAETLIDHVSQTLDLPYDLVQERNMYPFEPSSPDDLKLPNGEIISHWSMPRMWPQLKKKVNWDSKKQEMAAFNKNNRWRKRGGALCPIRYQVGVLPRQAMINLYTDGTVLVTVDGTEMGQGLHTKVVQTVSYELGKLLGKPLPLHTIRIGDLASNVMPNAFATGGSTGSEGSCEAARMCCTQLVERLAAATKQTNDNPETEEPLTTWPEICNNAENLRFHLSAIARWRGVEDQELVYQNFGVAASIAEIDVVTGEIEILSSDLIYDCGKSLNPAIDIGQAEGAFVMGLGFYFTEKVVTSKHNGRMLNNNTWNYKPPLASDIPINFTVEFLQDSGFNKGILSSKCSGEPPLCLSTSAMMAVKSAIYSARSEVGLKGFFKLDTPATCADIALACGTNQTHFTLPDVPLPKM